MSKTRFRNPAYSGIQPRLRYRATTESGRLGNRNRTRKREKRIVLIIIFLYTILLLRIAYVLYNLTFDFLRVNQTPPFTMTRYFPLSTSFFLFALTFVAIAPQFGHATTGLNCFLGSNATAPGASILSYSMPEWTKCMNFTRICTNVTENICTQEDVDNGVYVTSFLGGTDDICQLYETVYGAECCDTDFCNHSPTEGLTCLLGNSTDGASAFYSSAWSRCLSAQFQCSEAMSLLCTLDQCAKRTTVTWYYGSESTDYCTSLASYPTYKNVYCCESGLCNTDTAPKTGLECHVSTNSSIISYRSSGFASCISHNVTCDQTLSSVCSDEEISAGSTKRVYSGKSESCSVLNASGDYQDLECCVENKCNAPAETGLSCYFKFGDTVTTVQSAEYVTCLSYRVLCTENNANTSPCSPSDIGRTVETLVGLDDASVCDMYTSMPGIDASCCNTNNCNIPSLSSQCYEALSSDATPTLVNVPQGQKCYWLTFDCTESDSGCSPGERVTYRSYGSDAICSHLAATYPTADFACCSTSGCNSAGLNNNNGATTTTRTATPTATPNSAQHALIAGQHGLEGALASMLAIVMGWML